MDFQLIATAVSTFLAPFTPYLIEAGKNVGNKLTDLISEKGGEAIWKKAQELWGKIETTLGGDAEVKGAAMMVSAKPENEDKQKMFADVLAVKLKENPALAEELMNLLGGQKAVQQVIANRKSSIKDVSQQMSGGGEQTIKADNNSRIQGVKQIKK